MSTRKYVRNAFLAVLAAISSVLVWAGRYAYGTRHYVGDIVAAVVVHEAVQYFDSPAEVPVAISPSRPALMDERMDTGSLPSSPSQPTANSLVPSAVPAPATAQRERHARRTAQAPSPGIFGQLGMDLGLVIDRTLGLEGYGNENWRKK